MTIRLGLHIPLEFFSPTEAIETAKQADAAELDLVVVNDHFMLPWTSNVGEAWTILAAMATVTQKIRLGPCVTPLPLRNPFIIAKMASMVDNLSKGRLIMGVGAGWFRDEFDILKVPFLELAERHNQTEEAIRLLRELWTKQSVTCRGRYYHAENVSLIPKPVQAPHPPFFLGGGSDTILSLTAKYGAGWMPFSPSQRGLQRRVKKLVSLLKTEGRDLSSIEIIPSIVFQLGANKKHAFDQLPSYLKSIQDSAGFRYLLGSPSDCAEQIQAYASKGATHLVLRIVNPSQISENIGTIQNEILSIL
jgi:probable F420-dependent oxidoreductase